MKQLLPFTTPTLLRNSVKTAVTLMIVIVLASQSTVSAVSTGAATTVALNDVLSKVTAELQRRSTEIDAAITAVSTTKLMDPTPKAKLLKTVTDAKATIDGFKSQVNNVKSLADAQALSKKIDDTYSQYALANAQAKSIGDASSQKDAQTQLSSVASSLQSLLDTGKANGSDTTAPQEQLDLVKKLIDSVGATMQSIIALVMALIGGDFKAAATIFQTILGQLTQNLATILGAQSSLQSLLSSGGSGAGGLLNINLGNLGGATDK